MTVPPLDRPTMDRSSWLIQRAKLHTLVQTTVCTLWRSRVASEAHTKVMDANKSRPPPPVSDSKKVGGGDDTSTAGGTGGVVITEEKRMRNFSDNFEKSSNDDNDNDGDHDDHSGGDINGHVVQPTLSIVFANNYVMTVTQRAMVRQMVKMGMGAPSGTTLSLC